MILFYMENFDASSIDPKAQEALHMRAVRTQGENGRTHQEAANDYGKKA